MGCNKSDRTSAVSNGQEFTVPTSSNPEVFSDQPSSGKQVIPLDAPKDKNNLIKYAFMLWGVGTLLPWNVICNQFVFFAHEVS